jgi:hypothetical protein
LATVEVKARAIAKRDEVSFEKAVAAVLEAEPALYSLYVGR